MAFHFDTFSIHNRSKSILSKSLPHLVDHPFADDEVDETYVPDTVSDSESDYSSSEDEAL